MEAAKEEAREDWKKRDDRVKIFFIGEQNADNPEIFHATDYRLMCAIVGHIT
ncbi:hypothetical protein AB9B48_13660 [Kluyvera ascorbata]|uniref:hypothetical protein n=1 Tax=Kluyvera ascorbata TaxID=51288 RepID=UPI00157D0C4C|nr:hypothetical protein [Escherichia coli]NUC52330.1 hypothetical protein [Escherichia coli]